MRKSFWGSMSPILLVPLPVSIQSIRDLNEQLAGPVNISDFDSFPTQIELKNIGAPFRVSSYLRVEIGEMD